MTDKPSDSLNRFLFEEFPVRGELVRLDATWQRVLERCDYPAPIRRLLGEAMAATALLAATIKFRGHLTLQIQGDGPVHLLVVQCSDALSLRGLAHWREDSDPEAAEDLVGRARLVITIEPDEGGERYQGIVEVNGDDVNEALETYFRQSEQLPTRLWLSAGEDSAAGMLLQNVPGESRDDDGWDRTVQLAETLTRGELLELPAMDLLYRLFHDEEVRVFEARPVSFRCSCSRERIERVLRSMGREENESILEDEGSIRVTCEFCNKQYEFDAVDVEQLFSTEVQTPPSGTRH